MYNFVLLSCFIQNKQLKNVLNLTIPNVSSAHNFNNHLIKVMQPENLSVVNHVTIVGNTLSGKSTLLSSFQELSDIVSEQNEPIVKQKNNNGNSKVTFCFGINHSNQKLSYSFEKQNYKVVKEQIDLMDQQEIVFTIYTETKNNQIIITMKNGNNTVVKEFLNNKEYSSFLFDTKNNNIELPTIVTEFGNFLKNNFYFIGNNSNNVNNKRSMDTLDFHEYISYLYMTYLLNKPKLEKSLNEYLNNFHINCDYSKIKEMLNNPNQSIDTNIQQLPNGLKTLLKYFFVLNKPEVKLLVIDDFDSNLDIDKCETLLKMIEEKYQQSCQRIFTLSSSFNPYLLSNEITRPDSCFLINDNKIKSLKDWTEKEIREVHNVPKLYIARHFHN